MCRYSSLTLKPRKEANLFDTLCALLCFIKMYSHEFCLAGLSAAQILNPWQKKGIVTEDCFATKKVCLSDSANLDSLRIRIFSPL